MTTYMFIGMIAGAALGLLVAHPSMNLPAFTGFHNDTLGDMFPILFVTVACGAVSGFHSLVSSGTSSKTVANEKDMLKVGYGAMVLESLLAVLALCVAGAAASADGTPAAGTPFQIFSSGVAGFFEMFGVPVYVAQCFMTMCVSALALVTLCVFMKVTGRSNKMLFPPLIIMLLVTGTALAERTIGLVKAIAAGSATFLVEGLQLIIAILLIILGLTIVINSLRAYFASRKNSEKA